MSQLTAGFELSPQQKQLWLAGADQFAFNSVISVAIEGSLDAEKLQHALHQVVARHEALRTTFARRPGMRLALQVVLPSLAPAWEASSLSALGAEQEAHLSEAVAEQQRTAFNLAEGPVLRAKLITLSPTKHVFVLSAPALCADGVSLQNVVREIAASYAGEKSTSEVFQYADFSAWQNEMSQSDDDDAKAAKEFWIGLLDGVSTLRLPFEKQSDGNTFEPGEAAVAVPAAAAGKGADFFAVCWHILQWKLTGQDAITVDYVNDGRNHEEVAASVGLFSKALPIPYEFEAARSFSTVLHELQSTKQRAYEQQDYFVSNEDAGSAVSFVGESPASPISAGNVKFSVLNQVSQTVRSKMQLRCLTKDNSSALSLAFDSQSFSRPMVEAVAAQFSVLLKSAAEKPSAPIAELEILDATERQRVVVDFNQTAKKYTGSGCFHYLFEEQAAKTPNQEALRFGETAFTYAELNARVNQLAHLLRSFGVKQDTAVGLCLERSAEMILGVLGILKAGGAYVPLIPDNPKERLAHQLSETKAPVLITEKKFLDSLPAFSGKILCLDQDQAMIAEKPSSNPEHINTPENTVYVIYTSGSTGVPKGVAVSHSNLTNYTNFICDKLKARTEALNFATVSTLGADLGNTAIFPALASGGCLHVIGYDTALAANLFADYSKRHPVDVLKITPSHLGTLLASPDGVGMLPRKYLVLGGEAAGWDLVRKVQSAGRCAVINHYGPTEATVGCCTFSINENSVSEWEPKTVPIGKPIANASIYILDSLLRPVPVGVPGELCIGGAGIAKGYLNQPQQTAERFVNDSFSQTSRRLYRTGDLARFLPDGNVEFLGRIDQQVKIRGFRVEPAEIENALKQHAAVQQAVVVPLQDKVGDKRLVAYVVAKKPSPTADDLRALLVSKLPEYMVPSAIMQLDSLPLTKNGKIDLAALPSPEHAAARAGISPRNTTEQQLFEIWRDVLHIDSFGVEDNFFELGGHSLLATQVISRVRSAFHVQLPLRSLFDSPTVAGLAAEILRAPQGAEEAELAKLLGELEGLSDEEAERLLASEIEGGPQSETR